MPFRNTPENKKKATEAQQAYRARVKAIRKPDRRLVEHLALKVMMFKWLEANDKRAIIAFEDALSGVLVDMGYEPRSVDQRLEQLFEGLKDDYLRAQLAARVGRPD